MRLASPAASFLPGNKRTRSLWVFIIAPWYKSSSAVVSFHKSEGAARRRPLLLHIRGLGDRGYLDIGGDRLELVEALGNALGDHVEGLGLSLRGDFSELAQVGARGLEG